MKPTNDPATSNAESSEEVLSGSQALVRCLLQHGVQTIFGYPGGAIMPVYDAFYEARQQLRHILVRHEQAAAHAAEGMARITGRAGVCIATSGPGATNLVTGIADAMLDSVPLVCITGQVAAPLLGTDAFQETDIVGITMPITKWNYQVTDAREIPEVIAKAFYIAEHGRPGPVLVDITKNAQLEKVPYKAATFATSETRFESPKPKADQIAQAVELINGAQRPLLLAGHGISISRAEKALVAFAEKAGIPVASTLLGVSCFPNAHPLNVGMLGMHGNYGPNLLTNEADVIIAVGMRFDDRVTGDLKRYATQAKIIHVDVDLAELHKNKHAHVAVHADARDVLEQWTASVKFVARPDWVEKFRVCAMEEASQVIGRDLQPETEGLRMGEVVNALSEVTDGKAVVVADVGQHQMAAARYYKFKTTNSYLCSGGLGTMGYALPAAIGASVVEKERPVVMVAGDGGFQMTLQELATIRQEQLSVKMLILNNNYLGMVRQWQQLFFDHRYSYVDLWNPSFVKLADAYGIPGEEITSRYTLREAIRRMMQTPGPYLLDVRVEKETNVFPMVPAGCSVSEIRLS